MHFGATIQVTLLSLGLGDRINQMRKSLLAVNLDLEDKKSRLEDLNKNLEQKVEERTEELQTANEELEAMNEELLATNDRLAETNTELENAQSIARKDMDMATNVQSTLFHKQAPETPEWDIAFEFRPMSGVSGDFYDFYEDSGRLTGLALFDVSGHGISSGLITMIARSVLWRNFNKGRNTELNLVLENANKELIREIGGIDNYITGILLRFTGDEIEYVNAGHTDLICRRDKTRNVEIVNLKDRDIKGCFLGIDEMDKQFGRLTFKVSSNDVLLLFTDCLYECN